MPYSLRDLKRAKNADHAVAINLGGDTTAPSGTFFRAIYVGGTGDIKVDTQFETSILFKSCTAGVVLNCVNVKKIYSSANGTSATNLVGLYDTPDNT